MIRTLLAAVISLCAASAAHAAPPPFTPDLATLQAVPRVQLPAAAVEKALAEPVKGRPYQYAVSVPITLAPRQGLSLARGAQASWRVRLHSPGAHSLGLQLEQAALPAGTQLWAYDPQARLTHGPYDANRIGRSGLWLPPVSGEELVLEVRGPAAAEAALKLGAARAFHGFRDWKEHGPPGDEGAGHCNIDITCPEAIDWAEEAGAVALILFGGQFQCTGQLINNARQDQKKLFLTANHCGIDGEAGPAESVKFYFGFTGSCRDGDHDSRPAPSFEGALRLAHDVQSDFTLLQIADPTNPPLPNNAYFAGWDATGRDTAAGGVAIHHPHGDEKKIAFHDGVPTREAVNIGTGCAIDAWEVQWRTNGGTTERGSSGAGLWDTSQRLIGILSGGGASCAAPAAPDYFARLEAGWTANEAPEGQLRHWLDPDETCVARVPGLDPDDYPGPNSGPGPVAPTGQNTRCVGPQSTCAGRGGGALDGLTMALLGLLALARRRRLQHHQQHAGHRDR